MHTAWKCVYRSSKTAVCCWKFTAPTNKFQDSRVGLYQCIWTIGTIYDAVCLFLYFGGFSCFLFLATDYFAFFALCSSPVPFISCVNLKKYMVLVLVSFKFTPNELTYASEKWCLIFLSKNICVRYIKKGIFLSIFGFCYTSTCKLPRKYHLFSFSLTGTQTVSTL